MPGMITDSVYSCTIDSLKAAFKSPKTPRFVTNLPYTPPTQVVGTSTQYDPAKVTCTMDSDGGQITLRPGSGGGSKSACFLRWQQNGCTGVSMEGVSIVISGPFQGCCFFLGRDNKSNSLVAMHANADGGGSEKLEKQRNLAADYMNKFHGGGPLHYHVSYEQMGRKQGWIVAVNQGDNCDVYYVEDEGQGSGFRLVGSCFNV